MTSKMDVYKAYIREAWANPPASVTAANGKFLSDDFQNFDKDGNVLMNKEAYVGMVLLLEAAFKDFKAVYGEMHEDGDGVIANFHFEGTHTGDFDLSGMGLGVIPASGKKLVWPNASAKFNIKGDKIVSIEDITGGMEWFLSPFGVKLPKA